MLGTVLAASAMVVQVLGASAASAFPPGDFRGTHVNGRAWGAEASLTHPLLGDITLGKVAAQGLACRPPDTGFNTVASASLPGDGSLVSLGVVVNEGESAVDPSLATVRESSTVADVSLLANLIHASTVSARARTTYDASGETNTGDADFVDLVVGGVAITADVSPNTEINLPGVRVVLNEQMISGNRFVVNAIHAYVNGALGYSGDIVVAHAETSLARGAGHLSGYAYLSFVRLQAGDPVDPVLDALSGRQNAVGLPCGGGASESVAAGVVIPAGPSGHILQSATSRSTVDGNVNQSGGKSHSTHTLEGLSLLDGRITADVLVAEAKTRSVAGGVQSTATTSVTNLRIDGTLYGDVNAGLNVKLPGIGSVRVNEQHCVDDQNDNSPCTGEHYSAITVYSLRVLVNTANPLLPLDAQVIVGAAHSDVHF